MTPTRTPRLAVAILDRFLPDNDPLAGDLLEAAGSRSRAWLYRQVALAVLLRSAAEIQTHKRMTAEALLVAGAMLLLLGFYAVVVATLLTQVLAFDAGGWLAATGRYASWQLLSTVPSFLLALAIGRVVARVHRHHRLAAILAFATSAAAAAFANLYLFVPDLLARPFVPYAGLQSALVAVFVAGLFAGLGPASARSPRGCQAVLG